MKKNYSFLTATLAATLLLGSCNRAEYAFRSNSPAYTPITESAAAPVIATDAITAQAGSAVAAPIRVITPAQNAASALAGTRAGQPASVPMQMEESTAPEAVDAVVKKESAKAAQPVKRRKTKSSKTVWIIIGIGVALALVRVLIASNKSE
ncbi:hypothetical protein [Hymenobacter sp. DG25A]|uniref:hypothetical protein n=1 Tax=Hymenobacter sp. DG25A TaxID=1385663 RepID=UPI0012F893DC|nr:hypothetical protein [Hymenobacter sp. DG25A]